MGLATIRLRDIKVRSSLLELLVNVCVGGGGGLCVCVRERERESCVISCIQIFTAEILYHIIAGNIEYGCIAGRLFFYLL